MENFQKEVLTGSQLRKYIWLDLFYPRQKSLRRDKNKIINQICLMLMLCANSARVCKTSPFKTT